MSMYCNRSQASLISQLSGEEKDRSVDMALFRRMDSSPPPSIRKDILQGMFAFNVLENKAINGCITFGKRSMKMVEYILSPIRAVLRSKLYASRGIN